MISNVHERSYPDQRGARHVGTELLEQRFQSLRTKLFSREIGSQLPEVVLAVTAKKRVDFFLESSLRKQIGWRIVGVHQRVFQLLNVGALFRSQILASKLQARVANAEKCFAELARSPLCRRSWIVQLMRQPGRKLAQTGQAVALLLHSRDLTDTVRHQPDQALRKLRHFRHEILKLGRGKSQQSTFGQRASRHGELLHAGIRKRPSDVAGVDGEHKDFATQIAAHLQLATQNHEHCIRGIALAQIDLASLETQLFRLVEKPVKLVIGKICKFRYFAQFGFVSH